MKRIPAKSFGLLSFIALGIILAACGPSAEQLAAQTAAAWTPTPTRTPFPIYTPIPTNTPIPPPTPTLILPTTFPTLPPIPVGDSPETILQNTQLAMAAAQSYHFELEMLFDIAAPGMSMAFPAIFSGDFQAPDRMQASLSMNILGSVIETQVVVIGDASYSTDPETGEWLPKSSSLFPVEPLDFVGSYDTELLNAELVGIEEIDGVQAYHLTGTVDAKELGEDFSAVQADVQMEYWIGVDDFLVRRITMVVFMVAEVEAGYGEDAEMLINVDMMLSDFGKEVIIEPPVE